MPIKGPSSRRPQKPETQSQPIREHLPGEPPKELAADNSHPRSAEVIYMTILAAIAIVVINGIWIAN